MKKIDLFPTTLQYKNYGNALSPLNKRLVEDIETEMQGHGATLYHKEGLDAGGWVLLDFGDVVVHMFGLEEREYYAIEEVWHQGVEAVRIQ